MSVWEMLKVKRDLRPDNWVSGLALGLIGAVIAVLGQVVYLLWQ